MDKISSIQQYKSIIAVTKQNEFKLSNCFFLAAEINRKITRGSLLFEYIKNGVLLFDDLTDFYRCYFFLPVADNPEKIQLDKNAVIEFPFNGSMNEKQLLQIEKVNAMGFSLGRESGMMCSSATAVVTSSAEPANGICCLADVRDAEQILNLMNIVFDPLYSFLPSMQELCDDIKEGRVIVIRDGEKIAAALISSFEKKIAMIKQVAVNPAYRGKQFGKVLLQAYHSKYCGEASLFQHWVDLNNYTAINMYRKFGYEFNLRKANEYILRVKEK